MWKKIEAKVAAWVRSVKGRVWSVWARAAAVRALKTVAQTMVSNLGIAAVLSPGDWLAALSASVLAGLVSLATSLVGLPEEQDEPDNTRSWIKSAMIRSIKTIGQSVASSLAAFTFLSEVHWPAVLAAALIAGALSILTSIAGLPEAPKASDNT